LASVPGTEYGQGKPELCHDKNDAGNHQRAMELRIDLISEIADRGWEPPDFGQEEVNRNNRENHEESGKGKRDCSRALLSAFSLHLPPLRIQAGPPRIEETTHSHPGGRALWRKVIAAKRTDIIYIPSGFSSFSAVP